MGKLLAVVSVHSFMGQEPHVSFGVLFDGDDSSAAEALAGVQVPIKLCGSRNCSPKNQDKQKDGLLHNSIY